MCVVWKTQTVVWQHAEWFLTFCLPLQSLDRSTPSWEPTCTLRHVLVAPLTLEQCMQDQKTASAAAKTIETCLREHPSYAKLLLDPHQLTSHTKNLHEKILTQVYHTVRVAISGYRYTVPHMLCICRTSGMIQRRTPCWMFCGHHCKA